jgi:hypothetical protein
MQLPAWLLVALVALATFRLARLLTADEITRPIRDWVYRRDDRRPGRQPDDGQLGRLAYFITCPWCVSMYAGPATAFVAVWWPTNRAVLVALVGLAASAVTGIVATLLPDD